MRLFFSIVIFILSCSAVFSQEAVLDFEHYFNVEDKRVRAIEAFYTESVDQTVFLLKDNTQQTAYLFDKNFNEVGDGLRVLKETRKFQNTMSLAAVEESVYSFLMANDEFAKWGLLDLNFNARTVVARELPLKLKKANFLSTFALTKKHWIVSLGKNSSIIRIQNIDAEGNIENDDYDFSDYDFSGGLRSISNIYQLAKAKSEDFTADFIEESTPLSLLSTNEKLKVYRHQDQLTITIDNSRDYTYIIKIDVLAKTSEVITIEKEALAERSSFEDSNSFIFEDKLFTLKTTFDVLNLNIKDLKSKEVLKTITVTGEDDIWFRNTPIFQKGLGAKKESQITNTKTFLRKVTNSEPAISVHKQNDDFILTIGASKFIDKNDEALLLGAFVGGTSGYLMVSFFLNPVSKNYLDYASTKTTRFQTVLNKDLEHIEDKVVKRNAFDAIIDYDQAHSIKGAKTVFKIKEDYYFAYIDKETDKMKCIKF